MKFKIRAMPQDFGDSDGPDRRDFGKTHLCIGMYVYLENERPKGFYLYCGARFYERLPDQMFLDYIDLYWCDLVDETIPSDWIIKVSPSHSNYPVLMMTTPALAEPYLLDSLVEGEPEAIAALRSELIKLNLISESSHS